MSEQDKDAIEKQKAWLTEQDKLNRNISDQIAEQIESKQLAELTELTELSREIIREAVLGIKPSTIH